MRSDRWIALAIDHAFRFARPVVGISFKTEAFEKAMPIALDPTPPIAVAFDKGRHVAPFHTGSIDTRHLVLGAILVQPVGKQPEIHGTSVEHIGASDCAKALKMIEK